MPKPRVNLKLTAQNVALRTAKAVERRPQRVHLGTTESGTAGFFTGHYLAWPLQYADYVRYLHDEDAARRRAEALGFEYVPLEQPGEF